MSTSEAIPVVRGMGLADRLLLGHMLQPLLRKASWFSHRNQGFLGKGRCRGQNKHIPGHMLLEKTFSIPKQREGSFRHRCGLWDIA